MTKKSKTIGSDTWEWEETTKAAIENCTLPIDL